MGVLKFLQTSSKPNFTMILNRPPFIRTSWKSLMTKDNSPCPSLIMSIAGFQGSN